MPTHVSVIIPFRGDAQLLHWTLQGYAQQQLPPDTTLDVLVGGDGCLAPAPPTAPATPQIRFHTQELPRMGAAAIRNALAAHTTADLIIFGNADARPDPDMVSTHVRTLLALPPGSMVLGSAPWETPTGGGGATVFDALLADSPAVFFYHQLQPHHWYDFRHAWTLNLSLRAADYAAAGGFEPRLRPVYYEDLAFGHRVMTLTGDPAARGPTRPGIYYQPAARVLHRHPTTLDQYLNREELLGLMAPVLATYAPDVFAALHSTATLAQLAQDYRAWLKLDAPMHQWIHSRLAEWATLPATTLGTGDSRQRTLLTIYQMHIPLKRLAFRLGFLRGLDLTDDTHWLDRTPQALWKHHLALP